MKVLVKMTFAVEVPDEASDPYDYAIDYAMCTTDHPIDMQVEEAA